MDIRTLRTIGLAFIAAPAFWLAAGSADTAHAAAARATQNMQIHERARGSSTVLSVVPKGARVGLFGCTSGWCRVNYRGTWGYAQRSHMRQEARETGGPLFGFGQTRRGFRPDNSNANDPVFYGRYRN